MNKYFDDIETINNYKSSNSIKDIEAKEQYINDCKKEIKKEAEKVISLIDSGHSYILKGLRNTFYDLLTDIINIYIDYFISDAYKDETQISLHLMQGKKVEKDFFNKPKLIEDFNFEKMHYFLISIEYIFIEVISQLPDFIIKEGTYKDLSEKIKLIFNPLLYPYLQDENVDKDIEEAFKLFINLEDETARKEAINFLKQLTDEQNKQKQKQ